MQNQRKPSTPEVTLALRSSGTQPASGKLRRWIAATTLLSLVGCGVTATQPLWRNNLGTQQVSAPQGLAVSGEGEVFQLFVSSDRLHLRKLSAAGDELWRTQLSEESVNASAARLVLADGAIFATSSLTGIAHLDNNGTILHRFVVAPIGAHIDQLATAPQGNVLVSYSGDSLSSTLSAFSASGQQQWQHQWQTHQPVQFAALENGNVLTLTSDGSSQQAQIGLFDSLGSAITDETIALTGTQPKLVSGNDARLLVDQFNVSRLDDNGDIQWTQSFNRLPHCTVAEGGESACWFKEETPIFPPISAPRYASISWLDANGTIKNSYTLYGSLSGDITMQELLYNGNHHWTIRNFISESAGLSTSSSTKRLNHYTKYSAIDGYGIALKSVTMTPSVFSTTTAAPTVGEYTTDGDVIGANVFANGQLYSAGSTRLSEKGFVATYKLP